MPVPLTHSSAHTPHSPNMSSLAAFAPAPAAAALRAPAARRHHSIRVGIRAEAAPDSSAVPVINTRRALLGSAVAGAMSVALTPARADAKAGPLATPAVP